MMNVVTGSSHSNQLSFEKSYHGISDSHSNKMVISTSAMKELYGDLNFQQIRFHCRKHSVGRTFHVVTAANSSGNAVVQYFSGLTDVEPMEDDNSELARRCSEWYHGKWSLDTATLNDHTAFIYGKYHWSLNLQNHRPFECDDYGASQSSGDFWKVFVR